MIRVGLTGSLGAGKSTVGRLFESWGARRVDADRLARLAVEPGRPAHRRIREAFGEDALGDDGTVDRSALRRIVFRDPAARRRLEEIVHPEVGRLRGEALQRAHRDGSAVVVEEIPLLFEVGMEDEFDLVVVVDAPAEVRAERLREARGLSREEFEAMEAAQLPAEEKRSRADRVIHNDGSPEELTRRARRVWDDLVRADGSPSP